ncbi:hypothetical protein SELMODRAFT_102495, partial [Selaginella moellendorffii]
MEEKKADFAIDSEEIHVPLPLPPAATANSIRFFDNEQPISLPSSRLRFHVVLIVAQAGFAGYEVLVRRRFGKGSSIIVYSVYKNCLGFMVLRFLSSFVEKKRKPVLNFPALFATFFLGVFGVCVSELCYLQGLKYTTPIFASAMRNVIPAFTFIFALIFRMEKVDIEKSHGIVKLVGTILLICGWMTLLVYKGQELLMSHFSYGNIPTLSIAHHSIRLGVIHLELNNEQYGILFLVISCVSFSIFLTLQGFLMEKYAAPISFASFAFFFGTIQVAVIAAIYVHHKSQWLKFSIADGINIAYGGIIGSMVFGIQSWGVKQGGPMLVAAYQPLETIITIILAFFLLRESLNLGSLVGGSIILLGLYLVVWGK